MLQTPFLPFSISLICPSSSHSCSTSFVPARPPLHRKYVDCRAQLVSHSPIYKQTIFKSRNITKLRFVTRYWKDMILILWNIIVLCCFILYYRIILFYKLNVRPILSFINSQYSYNNTLIMPYTDDLQQYMLYINKLINDNNLSKTYK